MPLPPPLLVSTVTSTEALAGPPSPVQVIVNRVFVETVGLCCDPEVARLLPLQPPDAAQLEALVELQVSVVVPPALTLVGEALKETVGGGDCSSWMPYSP